MFERIGREKRIITEDTVEQSREELPFDTKKYIMRETENLWIAEEDLKKRMLISSIASYSLVGGLTPSIVEGLKSCGFRLFVKSVFATSKYFPYCAKLRGEGECCYNMGAPRSYFDYVGDIPVTVVERAETALKQGINYLTIHSLQPLPLKEPLRKVDPIMIGWVDNPDIHGSFRNEQGNTLANPLSVGVLIAVWDNDKELEL